MKMVYLATFYSSYQGIPTWLKYIKMWYNWHRVNKIVTKCIRRGYVVFSPITHSHVIGVYPGTTLTDYELWMGQDKWYVEHCDELWILDHPLISQSYGVNKELNWAKEQGKPVRWLNEKGDFIQHA